MAFKLLHMSWYLLNFPIVYLQNSTKTNSINIPTDLTPKGVNLITRKDLQDEHTF